jgi:hypothetical protein
MVDSEQTGLVTKLKVEDMPPDPRHPGKHINPETGIWPTCEWGYECQRGFISDQRFGSGQVIKRTSRGVTRRWGQSEGHGMRCVPRQVRNREGEQNNERQ